MVAVVTDAVPMGGHRVAVRFRDGFSGVLDVSKYLKYPAYEVLNDPRVFRHRQGGRRHRRVV